MKTPDHLHPNLLPSDSLQPRGSVRQPANSQAAARGRTREAASPRVSAIPGRASRAGGVGGVH